MKLNLRKSAIILIIAINAKRFAFLCEKKLVQLL
jgi:hypothetical protein